MDRERQLSNVAFGGAWSEEIPENEALAAALDRLDQAVTDTLYEDLRRSEGVAEAVVIVAAAHPKEAILRKAWAKALDLQNAGLRSGELRRVAGALRAGIGVRAQ